MFDKSTLLSYNSAMRQHYDYYALLSILRSYQREEGWFEFKENNIDPECLGIYVSALSNTAALTEHPYGYLVWGVSDGTHEVVGTSFSPKKEKKGNMELDAWLAINTNPRIDVSFIELDVEGARVVIMEVPAAVSCPVRFMKDEYIRIGAVNQPLSLYPDIERELWRRFDRIPPEMRKLTTGLRGEAIPDLLSVDSYFHMLRLQVPTTLEEKLNRFEQENFIQKDDNGTYSITVLGALLFAIDFNLFPSIASKAFRIIRYEGSGRVNAINDVIIPSGYAFSFENICSTAENMLPIHEIIGSGLRKDVRMFPSSIWREVVANMMIHQDLSVSGSGPLLEVFDSRIEGTNPGTLLVPRDRIIDAPPRARNEALAAFLRRIHVCEERGSGFDRIEESLAAYCLPSVLAENSEGYTRVKIFWYPSFQKWTMEDRMRTCYFSTCLNYIESVPVSNSVIRERLGISSSNSAVVSRLMNAAVEEGLIKVKDSSQGAKARRYVPYWA